MTKLKNTPTAGTVSPRFDSWAGSMRHKANNTDGVGNKTHNPNKMSLSTSRAIASKAIWPFFVKVGKEESTLGNVRTGRVNRTESGRKAVNFNRMLPVTVLANETLERRCRLGWATCVSRFSTKGAKS